MMQRAATSILPAAAGYAAGAVGEGGGGGAIATSVQGATIGQLLSGQNYTSAAAKQYYVMPKDMMAQSPADYAQGNYYAAQSMGLQPGVGGLTSQNFATVQKGTQQLMTLSPGMSYQSAMAAQNQMNQPQTLNAALRVGINLRPGGKMLTPEQQNEQIFNRMFQGKKPTKDEFDQVMSSGYGQSNLASIGITPGSDEYNQFMNYSRTKIGMQEQGKGMPDVGTKKGAQEAGLNTPYNDQLRVQSKESQLKSQAEPTLAKAADTLNKAANALLGAVQKIGATPGGGGGFFSQIGQHLGLTGGGGGGLLSGFSLHLQGGGEVPDVWQGDLNKTPMGKLPGVSSNFFKNIGRLFGGLNGEADTDKVPTLLSPGERVLSKSEKKSVEKSLAGQSGTSRGYWGPKVAGSQADSSTVAGLLSTKINDLDQTTVAYSLFNKPPDGSLISMMLSQGGQKGGGAQGGKPPDAWVEGQIDASGKTGQTGKASGTRTGQQTGGKTNANQPEESQKKKSGGILGTIGDVLGGVVKGVGGVVGSLLGGGAGLGGAGGGAGGLGGGPGGGLLGTGFAGAPAPSVGTLPWNYKMLTSTPVDMSSLFDKQSASSDDSSSDDSSSSVVGSAPSGNLKGWISQAMKITNVSGDAWTNGLNLIIQKESGGNPGVTNNWDSNAAAGHASTGLMQLIPSTFKANAVPGYDKNINDPVSNIAAGIKYIESRYHDISNVPGVKAVAAGGAYVGYARGTQRIAETQLALLHRGESVVPAADNYGTAPYNRNGAMNGGGNVTHLNFKTGSITLQVPANSTQTQMENIAKQFVQAVSKPGVIAAVRSS